MNYHAGNTCVFMESIRVNHKAQLLLSGVELPLAQRTTGKSRLLWSLVMEWTLFIISRLHIVISEAVFSPLGKYLSLKMSWVLIYTVDSFWDTYLHLCNPSNATCLHSFCKKWFYNNSNMHISCKYCTAKIRKCSMHITFFLILT